MTLANAKSRLNPVGGETAGYITPADVKLSYDDLQDAWQSDDDVVAAVANAAAASATAAGATANTALSTAQTALDLAQSAGATPQGIYIETFTGATDDAKFAAACSYAAAQTYRPPILLLPKNYSFAPFNTFDGLRLVGAPGGSSQADRAGAAGAVATRVTCTGSGSWLIPTADQKSAPYDISIQGIAFTGNSGLAWWEHASMPLWYSNLRDLTFSGFKSVLGTQSNKMLVTGCVFDGFWQINNSYDGAIHIGGADSILWSDGLLLDSNTAYVGSGQYHMWLDYLAKSQVGGAGVIYITAEGDWGGIKITGSTTGEGPVFVSNVIVEGRNAGAPGEIACVRQESGWSYLTNIWASYCQAYPIQVTGGLMVLDKGAYKPCTASPPDRWVNHTGGTLNVARCYQSGVAAPVVNSSGGTIVADATVTVV